MTPTPPQQAETGQGDSNPMSAHAPTPTTLAYIETMLRGDTDRLQIADYLRDHVRPAAVALSPDHPDPEGNR